MADRTSAEIFGEIFTYLAKQRKPDEKAALHFWELSQNYDFSNSQMECDDALIKLGLAKRGVDPDYPDEGEVTLYLGDF